MSAIPVTERIYLAAEAWAETSGLRVAEATCRHSPCGPSGGEDAEFACVVRDSEDRVRLDILMPADGIDALRAGDSAAIVDLLDLAWAKKRTASPSD